MHCPVAQQAARFDDLRVLSFFPNIFMNIAHQFQQIIIFLAQNGLVAVLKKMTLRS
jgi:hypothetical protein